MAEIGGGFVDSGCALGLPTSEGQKAQRSLYVKKTAYKRAKVAERWAAGMASGRGKILSRATEDHGESPFTLSVQA